MISILVASVMAAGTWASYQGVKATRIETAHRAQAAADQPADILNSQRSSEQLRQLASDREVRQFLETRTEAARTAADARLRLLTASTPRRVELWDAAGSRLIEIPVPHPTSRASYGHEVVMPGINGCDLADRLRRMRPEMKVLYMSGYTDDAVVRHGVVAEGTPFLNKLFSNVEFLGTIRRLLDTAPTNDNAAVPLQPRGRARR